MIIFTTNCKQEYWEWVAVSPPGDLPDPGIELTSAALQADSLPAEQSGKSDESEGFVYPQK